MSSLATQSPGIEERLRSWQPDPVLPGWLNALRRQAIQAYFDLAPPDRSLEAWHYGDSRRFALANLSEAGSDSAFGGEKYQKVCSLTKQAGRIACLSMLGQTRQSVPGVQSQANGLTVATFEESLAQHGELLHRYLGDQQLRFDRDKMLAAHYATLDSGCLIHVPEGHRASEDVHLIFQAGSAGTLVSPHVFVAAGKGSSVNVYVHLLSEDYSERNLMLGVVQVECEEGAKVELTKVQHLGHKTDAWLHQSVRLAADAKLHTLDMHLGGSSVRSESATLLSAAGADAQMRAAYLGRERMRLDFYTHQDHAAPNTTSNLLYKGALNDRARASYQGMISVREHCRGTDAYQSHRALVLSPQARADSSPQLEIGTNDVRCTHGSAISNVGAGELFYLESRGIAPETARRLLVSGFISEVADGISFQPLRDYIYSYLLEHV